MANKKLTEAIAAARSSQSAPAGAASEAQSFEVAGDLDTVMEAWRRVYETYRRAQMIASNPHRLHTTPLAVNQRCAVMVGRYGGQIVSTLTAIVDGDSLGHGVPADEAYGEALTQLRREGRRPMEICLIADRRRHFARVHDAMQQLMRHAIYFGLYMDVSDVVIAVDREYTGVYQRLFGFTPFTPSRPYGAFDSQFSTLLRLDLDTELEQRPLRPAMANYLHSQLRADVFDQRYQFNADEVAGSPLGQYLDEQAGGGPKPAA